MRTFFTNSDPVVPVNGPRALLQAAIARGVSPAAVLRGTELTEAMLESPEVRISYAQFGTLIVNALRATGEPGLGLELGFATHLPHVGVLGLAVASSATIRDALHMLSRHYHALVPALELSLSEHDEEACLTLRETLPLGGLLPFTTEWVLGGFVVLARGLGVSELPVKELRLAYPRPAYAARYDALHACEKRFDQPKTEVVFDAALLARRMPSADPATAKLAAQYCVQLSPSATEGGGLLGQLRTRLASVRGPLPDLDTLARELRTSSRSLRRFLQDMNTSYQALCDDALRARAEELVGATDLSFADIAEQLGYGDVRSFRRAFKRWLGTTPNAYRAARRE